MIRLLGDALLRWSELMNVCFVIPQLTSFYFANHSDLHLSNFETSLQSHYCPVSIFVFVYYGIMI